MVDAYRRNFAAGAAFPTSPAKTKTCWLTNLDETANWRLQVHRLPNPEDKISKFRYLYNSGLSLTDAMAQAGYASSSGFRATFLKSEGRSLKDWLKDQAPHLVIDARMLRAEALLQTSNLGVGQIAIDAGWLSSQAFRKAFAKHYGVSPRQWRKIHQPKI